MQESFIIDRLGKLAGTFPGRVGRRDLNATPSPSAERETLGQKQTQGGADCE